MGFSCGIYWAPKINEDITLHEIDSVQVYYEYFRNEWAQKNYSTAEKYLESRGYSMPSQDLRDFYIPYIHQDEYGDYNVTHEIGVWYSVGGLLHDWITTNLTKNSSDKFDNTYELTKKDVVNLLTFAFQGYREEIGEAAYISRAYVYKEDENYKEPIIMSYPCDGVEFTTEDKKVIRVENRGEYLGEAEAVFIKEYGIALDHVYFYESLINACITMLSDLDWDNIKVFYNGGW